MKIAIKYSERLIQLRILPILALFFLSTSQSCFAQTYSGTIDHDGIYSFDYTIVCGSPANTALVTVEYTTPEPVGLVPQLHLGGGSFVNMNTPSPYTYTLTGFTNCEFSFEFYMAWMAGGLYQSPAPLTPELLSLPVELFQFEVKKTEDGTVNLDWLTISERNSDYFVVERTIDGQEWETLGNVKAKGNSTATNSYSYVDSNPKYSTDGFCYYRLKMVDFDGVHEYSIVRSVLRSESDGMLPSLFPNPTNGELNIDFSQIDWSLGSVQLQVYNSQGRKVREEAYMQVNNEKIDLINFPSSMYFFRFVQGVRVIARRAVLKVD